MDKYIYNGHILPELICNNEAYPYVYLYKNVAYAFSAPIDIGNQYSVKVEPPFLRSTLKLDENLVEYWGEWENVTSSKTISQYNLYWANHDIIKSDGSLYLATSEPNSVSYPIVIYEGDVTTKDKGYGDSAGDQIVGIAERFGVGDTVRVTIDGVTGVYKTKQVPTSTQALVGNAGLNGNDVEADDEGGDWLFASFDSPGARDLYFYTRTAGTYKLKIELLASEPTLPEGDFYKVINGAWVKHDAVRPMGGEWVKQDAYLY